MVGLRTPVTVRMVCVLRAQLWFLSVIPVDWIWLIVLKTDLLLGPSGCWLLRLGTIAGNTFGVPDSPLKEISTQLISGTSSILGDS